MQLISRKIRIDFMGKRKLAMAISAALILLSIISFFTRGLALGIDFTGGTLVEVGYSESAELAPIRKLLSEAGFDDAVVQHFGSSRDVLIRIQPREDKDSAKLSNEIFSVLQEGAPAGGVELRRAEFVGPQVGEELTESGGLALLYALAGILVYVAFRFEYRFAAGSVIALIHDVIITVGFFSIFQFEFDLTVLAAVLAVIGYSLNDTIVVFDRIRENFRKVRKGSTQEIINGSLNQTLSRTLMTSLTTLLVLLALLIFGGEIIFGFALALIIGVVIGTYSSVYVAGTALLIMGIDRTDMLPVKKDGDELDAMP